MNGLIFLIFMVLLMLVLFRLASKTTVKVGSGRSRRAGRGRETTPAATAAMKHADYLGGADFVSLTDVGLLAYRHTKEPKLIRYGDVMTDTRFLRPFAELWLPYKASGQVRFELFDGDGRLRYADEAGYDLDRGKNMLLPGTWLPLEGKVIKPEDWTLRVLAGDTLLGIHQFGWKSVGGGRIQQYVDHDGEINPALQNLLRAKPREAVSLSELLADQEE